MKPIPQPITEVLHGHTVVDNFRWLESIDDPEVLKWVSDCNAELEATLMGDQFAALSDEYRTLYSATSRTVPVLVGDRCYYFERTAELAQPILYYRPTIDSDPVVIVDPNSIDPTGSTTVDSWSVSRSGRYVAYGLSANGTESSTMSIHDTTQGTNLPYTIPNCRYSHVEWVPDDSGFYYTRKLDPSQVPAGQEHMHTKVFFHTIGTDPLNDEMIFGQDRPYDDMVGIELSPDGTYLGIRAGRLWTENELYLYHTQTGEIETLIADIPALFSLVFWNNRILLKTNYQANNYRVLWSTYADRHNPIDTWHELLPMTDQVLESVDVTEGQLLALYSANACHSIVRYDSEGNRLGLVPLPEYASVGGISTRPDEESFAYSVSSLIVPTTIYRYDPGSDSYVVFYALASTIVSDEYRIQQLWYSSADGTRVPMFVVARTEVVLDGKNPTIVYGYGGFAVSVNPSYSAQWVPWLSRGGVVVIANIRGGSEFGSQWHTTAMKHNKQRSYDDFIAAAEYMIEAGYTSSEYLGCVGSSNGGLLVLAAMTQRPDLYGAVCSHVPLTDMVRFPQFGMAIRWVHEYGDPTDPADLEHILKWSPYHNVAVGQQYPPLLITTGLHDSRVDTLHARKMAAQVALANPDNTVLLFTDMKAGHGAGKSSEQVITSAAYMMTFFTKYLER